jgi:flagellar basal body-associated protein FliL
MVEDINAVIISTIIAFIVSAIGSYVSYFFSIKKAEKDARRDYEYEAKNGYTRNASPFFLNYQNYQKVRLGEFMHLQKMPKKEI